jgi:hypothetical protein
VSVPAVQNPDPAPVFPRQTHVPVLRDYKVFDLHHFQNFVVKIVHIFKAPNFFF